MHSSRMRTACLESSKVSLFCLLFESDLKNAGQVSASHSDYGADSPSGTIENKLYAHLFFDPESAPFL